MPRLRIMVLVGLLSAVAGALRGQDEAPAAPEGTWKVHLPTLAEAQGRPLLLIKIEKTKAGWKGELLASRLPGKAEVEKVGATDKALTFTVQATGLTIPFEVRLGEAKAAKLYGEARVARTTHAVEFERSKLTTLDRYEELREELANEPLGIRAALLAQALIGAAEDKKVKADEVRRWADKAYKSAQLYGPRLTRETLLNLARGLAEQKGFEATALQYANRAEAALDEKTENAAAVKEVLDTLAEVLEKAGKKDEAAKVRVRLAKLDFRIKPAKFAGRKAKSDRVVLAEVFTTAHAKTGVVTGKAIEALQKTFKDDELSVLVYYQHQAGGDPLSSPESEERLAFYGPNIRNLPVVVLNGKTVVPGGGAEEDGQERYDSYVGNISPLLEAPARGQLTLNAVRKGDKIDVTADVSKLEESGEDVKLRVVLAEAETAYKGKSGGAAHYNVVRAMPGGFEGTVLKKKELKKTFSIDLAELRKGLVKYMAEVDKKRPFPDKERPLDLKKLRVIAFVQNDANNEVLQAAQVEVKGE